MLKKLFYLFAICSVMIISSCDDNGTKSVDEVVTYDQIKNLPNTFNCTIDEGDYSWVLHPASTDFHAKITANGISVSGSDVQNEGTSIIAFNLPRKTGTGITQSSSLILNHPESNRIFKYISNTMSTNYNIKFYSDSLIYGTFTATARDANSAIVSVTSGSFKIPIAQ